ncbi:hypothetical protein F4808DRAFT_458790 [Astrocystis sublimbata]|nr:hypothetical protein F4808DRAFT_458790 [Astrocystis sublimbata]
MSPSGHAAVLTAKPLLPPTPGFSSRSLHSEDHSSSKLKKRAKSIDVDEANHSDIARLSLYTPTTSRAFILYRQAWQGHFAALHPGLANPEISKLIGEKWREQPETVKNEWKQLAEEEKIRHQRQYPGYRYQPRRGGKNGSGRPSSSSGDTPGRCPKCGGRYIATPRTPTTPFGVATPPPPPSKRPPHSMQPFLSNEHSRRGSASSTGSGLPMEGHMRRYPPPPLRDIDEDYSAMSPGPRGHHPELPPDAKRRRYNGAPVYGPGDPHLGYAPVDARYQQRSSVSGPPMPSSGYGQGHGPGGHLPRPPMPHRSSLYSGHPTHPNHPSSSHMQPPPPPRQSISYQSVSAAPPSRPSGGFDESLRLPPLQSQVHEPPPMSSEHGARQSMPPAPPPPQQGHGTGLGIMNQGPPGGPVRQPPPQQQPPPPPSHAHPSHTGSPLPQKWPTLLKLDVLQSIAPPLRPTPGCPPFETRGPIIAVEGAPTAVLKEVSAVIEKALSASHEFAVKVWSEDTSTAIAHSSPVPHASTTSTSTEVNGTASNNNNNTNNNIKGDSDHSVAGAASMLTALKKATSTQMSPIASYVARMLKWHKTSEDLVRYITTNPSSCSLQLSSSSPSPNHQSGAADNSDGNRNTASPPNSNSNCKSQGGPTRIPIAILSDGYSLTFSDRYAGALHVHDAYRADDHWQWVATLWRGIVGADLTVCVKKFGAAPADAEDRGAGNHGSVEMAGPGVMVLRIPDGAKVDEKLERRLGFEIAEWVRAGSFMAGIGAQHG